jgi:hypothetical protein
MKRIRGRACRSSPGVVVVRRDAVSSCTDDECMIEIASNTPAVKAIGFINRRWRRVRGTDIEVVIPPSSVNVVITDGGVGENVRIEFQMQCVNQPG